MKNTPLEGNSHLKLEKREGIGEQGGGNFLPAKWFLGIEEFPSHRKRERGGEEHPKNESV